MAQTARDKYVAVIGLEVHAQLTTASKIYNRDAASFGDAPNTNIGVVTLAHPGTLPLLNKQAIAFAIRMGIACHCEISRFNIFDRKNYFYPDLPKGYQLTQDRTPICKGGYITIDHGESTIDIPLNRIHIEEDAGKSIHIASERDTLVDLNRAGVGLIEIVTEPAIHSAADAACLLAEIRQIVRYLGICDGNMEEGSLRCDANVSVMMKGATQLGRKVEVKNMNSMRNVQRAIEHEIERQIGILEEGGKVVSETRTFEAARGITHGMRAKEEMNDYRYFPDPDLSPLEVSEEWLASLRKTMPELPRELSQRFTRQYQLPAYDARVLTETRDLASYFETVCEHLKNFKAASNWVMGPVKACLNELNLEAHECPVRPEVLASLISLVESGALSFTIAAQRVFPALLENPDKSPMEVAQQLNLVQERNLDSILPIIDAVIKEFPLKVEEYKKGKKGIVSMFMGEVMKRSNGKADPKIASELINKKLQEV